MPRTRKIGPLEAANNAALATSDEPEGLDMNAETGRLTCENAELARLLFPLFRPNGRRKPASRERLPMPSDWLPPLF